MVVGIVWNGRNAGDVWRDLLSIPSSFAPRLGSITVKPVRLPTGEALNETVARCR